MRAMATVERQSGKTHEVFNHPAPLEDYNSFDADRPLVEALRREGADWAEAEAQELAKLFCRQAKHRAEALFADLWDNDDDAGRQAAAGILDGRYRWLEQGIIDPSGEGPMIPEEVKGSAAAVAS